MPRTLLNSDSSSGWRSLTLRLPSFIHIPSPPLLPPCGAAPAPAPAFQIPQQADKDSLTGLLQAVRNVDPSFQ